MGAQEVRAARNREQEQAQNDASRMAQRQSSKSAAFSKTRTAIQHEISKSEGSGMTMNWDQWESEFANLSMKSLLLQMVTSWAAFTKRSGVVQRARMQRNRDIGQWKERCEVARAERERRKQQQRAISARCPRLPLVQGTMPHRATSARRVLYRGQAPTSSTKFEELSTMYLSDGRGWEALLPPAAAFTPREPPQNGSRFRYGGRVGGPATAGRGGYGLDNDGSLSPRSWEAHWSHAGEVIAGRLRLSQFG